MNLQKLAKRAYHDAVRRGKITQHDTEEALHEQTYTTLLEELEEFKSSSEGTPSDVIKDSHSVEELADIAIGVFTEMYRRGVDPETVLHEKMKYNESREIKNR